MAVEKKFLSKWKYVVIENDQGGDLSKMWYVRWKEWGGKHRKKYGKLAHILDVEERRKALRKLRDYWDAELNGPLNKTVFEKIYGYLDEAAIRLKWRKKTCQTYRSRVKVLEDWIGHNEIGSETIAEFFRWYRDRCHPVTFNRRLADMRTWFEAVGEGELFPDDIDRIPNAESQPARFLQKEEIDALRSLILSRDKELWLAIRFMFNCAIRPGELRLLKKKHIFLEEQQVLIPADISKTNKRRWSPIPHSFIEDLGFLRDKQPNQYLFNSPVHKSSPVSQNHFSRKIREFMDELGFDNDYAPCYSWRHTSAMHGIKNGLTPREMKEVWGHHSLDQFLEYLRQFGGEARQEYKEKFKGI